MNNIRNNIKESITVYESERAPRDKPTITPGLEIGKFDDYTDSIILRECMYTGDESIIYNSMMNYRWSFDEIDGQVDNLIASVDDEKVKDANKIDYARYWNGYLVYMKPLLLFFNVSEIRIINMILQLLLVCIVIIGLEKRLGFRYALSFGATVAFMNPVALSASIQFYDVYYLMLFQMIIVIYCEKYLDKNKRKEKLLLVSGILVAFFDFLTYPIVAFGFLIILLAL